MPTVPTAEQIALVDRYLPDAAKQSVDDGGYGWTDDFVTEIMSSMAIGPARAVRFFWYQRVQETAEYLDVNKPLTQIHRQAREMLDYWDLVIQTNPNDPDAMEPQKIGAIGAGRPIRFGEIERPWCESNFA
jgi:hypothetical protein